MSARLGFKPQANSETPLKRTSKENFSFLVGAGLADNLCFLQITSQQNPPLLSLLARKLISGRVWFNELIYCWSLFFCFFTDIEEVRKAVQPESSN
jgi:hypothetical protein